MSISTGVGDDLFTVVQTHVGTAPTAPGADPTDLVLSTGDGNDRVAVRAIEDPASIDTGEGNDTVYVGSKAGIWDVHNAPLTEDFRFINTNGTTRSEEQHA